MQRDRSLLSEWEMEESGWDEHHRMGSEVCSPVPPWDGKQVQLHMAQRDWSMKDEW